MTTHHRVDVLAPYTIDVADPHRGERSALDPVSDRLGGQLELLGNLFDREELLVSHGKISKNIIRRDDL